MKLVLKALTLAALTTTVLGVAQAAFAAQPVIGTYRSTDLGGALYTGRASQSWGAAGNTLNGAGDVFNAQSWNGTALGTQWNFSCGVQASAASVVDNRSSGTGSVYVTNSFSGGTYSFSSGPWCTNGPCAGTTTLTVEQVTLQYVSGVAFSSVLNLNTSGHFNNSNCNLTFAIANGYGIGDTDNNSADPTYPALLDSNCGATRQYGAWSNIITITARIDCPVASKTSTWGQLKTLYR